MTTHWVRALAATCLVAAHAWAAAATVTALAPGVWWLPGRFVAGEQPDGNSVVFDAPDGLVIMDTGRHAAHSQALIDHIAHGGRPLAAIVNSHWHLDHIGGNATLKAAYPDAAVVASNAIEGARSGFLARYRDQLEAEINKLPAGAPGRDAMQGELAIISSRTAQTPTLVIDSTAARTLAGKPFVVGYEADAVTAGDVWLFEPASRVLASGDLVTLPAPLFDTACPQRWGSALGRLAEQPFEWLVPGHGAPMRRDQFQTYRRAYDGLVRCAASSAAKSECIAGWMHDAGSLIPAGDAPLARSLLDYYLDQLRAKPAALCPA